MSKSEFHFSCFFEQRAHPEYKVLFSEPAAAAVKISLPKSYFRLKQILRCTNRGLAALSRLAEITLQLRNMLLLGSVKTGHPCTGATVTGRSAAARQCNGFPRTCSNARFNHSKLLPLLPTLSLKRTVQQYLLLLLSPNR
jgi:hypothetical protein